MALSSDDACGGGCKWIALETPGAPRARLYMPMGRPPIAVFVALHGVKSHSGWFEPLAKALNEQGFALLALDRRGSGKNKRVPGLADAGLWMADLHSAMAYAATLGKMELLGWCGGARHLLLAVAEGARVDQLYLLAPGLVTSPEVRRRRDESTRVAGDTLPLPFDDDMFSKDERVRNFIRTDPDAWTTQPRAFANANAAIEPRVRSVERDIPVETFAILAENDEIIDVPQTRQLLGASHRVTLDSIPGGHAFILEHPQEVANRIASYYLRTHGPTHNAAVSAPAPATRSVFANRVEADYVIRDFRFRSGETLAQLRLHYRTLGQPRRDADGHITNAVLILHGTNVSARAFLQPQFGDVVFAPGGPLDLAKYYVILPDGIGHGQSSKPSDGAHMKFPHYDYEDMVTAQHELVQTALGVDHLQLILGTSMGCMHTFMWAEHWPDLMDAAMPIACMPIEIAGRNRVWRKMIMRAIEDDPEWKGGDYTAQPRAARETSVDLMMLAVGGPGAWQRKFPTAIAADNFLVETTAQLSSRFEANDWLYGFDASRTYDASAKLSSIRAKLTWVKFGDDFINPPELSALAQRAVSVVPHGRFILVPASAEGYGHSAQLWASTWQQHLAGLLSR